MTKKQAYKLWLKTTMAAHDAHAKYMAEHNTERGGYTVTASVYVVEPQKKD